MQKVIGTLLPFSSLVSKQFPNDKLASARLFIDWLESTHQSVWQMLPISPHYGLSPYSTAGIGVDPEIGSFDDLVALKDYAKTKNIELWGDLPFYLDKKSPLLEKYPQAFLKDSQFVAGALKDIHYSDRQAWGLPLYAYESAENNIEKLWEERIAFLANFFTKVRLDAAIRFFTYEKLSLEDEKNDTLCAGPGEGLFSKLVQFGRKSGLELFAEDISGLNMVSLRKCCQKLNVSTMSVFTMALAPGQTRIRLRDFRSDFPKNHIFYTSTHDTVPLAPYLQYLAPDQKKIIADRFGSSEPIEVRSFLMKKCQTLILPIQDWLLTGDRINIPGEINEANWRYKMTVPVEELPLFNR